MLGILSMLLVSSMLVQALSAGEVPDQTWLEEIRWAGLLAGAMAIIGTTGWAWEASRRRSQGGLQQD